MMAARVHLVRHVRLLTFPAISAIAIAGVFAGTASLSSAAQSAAQSAGGSKAGGVAGAASKPSAAITGKQSFDVVSIHPNNYDRTNHSHIYYSLDDSHFRCINVTAMDVVHWAYELPSSRILNAPDWARSAKFDIQARSDSAADEHFHGLPIADARHEKDRMVQALLRDRFHLAAHFDRRELPIYNLLPAKGGPKFTTVKDAPKHVDTTRRNGSVSLTITSSSRAMAELAEMLYGYTGRVVVDKTGLTGNYTIALQFAPDDSRLAVPGGQSMPAPDSGPSVFTALKEQLGLELKSGKGPVDVLVIDHMDPPGEN